MIVGQETYGWSFRPGEYYPWPYARLNSLRDFQACKSGVKALLHGYEAFEFAAHQPKTSRTPFWRAFRLVRDRLERKTGAKVGVLWSNLFRCDFKNGSVLNASARKLEEITVFQLGLLTQEVVALKPTSVLFLTGPYYDFALKREFSGVSYSRVGRREIGQFARLAHRDLPPNSFRTYHPGYLARDQERWNWLSALASLAVR